jgi:hypothetical protein
MTMQSGSGRSLPVCYGGHTPDHAAVRGNLLLAQPFPTARRAEAWIAADGSEKLGK